MTGPGAEEEYGMWPGPTYTDCKKCGKCTDSYFADYCDSCLKMDKDPLAFINQLLGNKT